MVTPTEHSPRFTHSRQPADSPLPEPVERLALVNIVLGMPQHNCQYHGICRIDLEDTVVGACPNRVSARMSYDAKRLQVCFLKEQLPVTTVKKHFASGYFIVLIDFTLPVFLQSIFQTPLVIRQGIYPVRETEAHYIVDF